MPRRYQNAPVVEALVDFRFVGSSPWDWTIPGLLFERVRGDYPEKGQENFLRVGLQQESAALTTNVGAGVSKMQFLRSDRTRIVQIGPDFLTINQLTPYPGWLALQPGVLDVLEKYRAVASPIGLSRIGLRYINRFDLGTEPIDLDDYFLSAPTIPPSIPQFFDTVFMSLDMRQQRESPSPSLRLIFGSDPQRPAGRLRFLMDLEYSAQGDAVPKFTDVPTWLDSAHDAIERTFDASCTERTHLEILREVRE